MLPDVRDEQQRAVEERGFAWLGGDPQPHPAYAGALRRPGFRLDVMETEGRSLCDHQ